MSVLKLIPRTIAKLRRDGYKRSYKAVSSLCYDYYFDWKYNIDTAAWVSHEDLVKENALAEHTGHYQPTNVLLIRKLFKQLNIPKTEVFCDIGSGKGRALILAAENGFKSVKGIELSNNLCTITEKNIESYKKKTKNSTKIEVFNNDASQFEYSDDETLFFMYNPFDDVILRKVLKNIQKSLTRNPRTVRIIYINPTQKSILEQELKIKKVTNYTWNEDYTIYEL